MERAVPVTGVSELVLEVVDLEAAEAFYAGHDPDRLAPEDYETAVAPLRERPEFLQETRFPGADDSRAAYLRDPDGNVVELWTWDVGRHLDPDG